MCWTRTTIIQRLVPVLIAGLWVSLCAGELIPFTNYSSAAQLGWLATGQDVWQGRYQDGPWTWHPSQGGPMPYWGAGASTDFEILSVEVIPEADLIFRLSQIPDVVLTARDPGTEEIVGTMRLSGQSEILLDLNAARAIVDEEHGVILLKYWNEEPMAMEVLDATGVWAGMDLVDPAFHLKGWSFRPIMEGMDLQTNIFAAPTIGGFMESVMTGSVVPEPATILTLGAGAWLLLRRRRR